MARFVYEAKKTPQDVIKGVLVADNKAAAVQKIARLGYYIISLDEENALAAPGAPVGVAASIFTRITLKDTADFTRQLSDLLESGLTIVKTLDL